MAAITRRRLLCSAGFALLPLSAAETDLEVVFSLPSKVGSFVLPPGLYKLKLQGSLLLLTDRATKKSYNALVRIEKTNKRSPFTAAQGRNVDGVQRIESIVLEGADYKLVF